MICKQRGGYGCLFGMDWSGVGVFIMKKDSEKDGWIMIIFILLSPVISALIILPCLCAMICEYLGIDERIGVIIGSILTVFLVYDLLTNPNQAVVDSPYIGRDGNMHNY